MIHSEQHLKHQKPTPPPVMELRPNRQKSEFQERSLQIWRWLNQMLYHTEPQLRVWYTCDPSGELLWSAYNPATNQAVYDLTESGMRRWLEHRHL